MTVLRFAPDAPYIAYQVRGSFSIDSDAPPDAVRKAGYNCGAKFIAHLARQGFELKGGLNFDWRPHPHYEAMEMVTKDVQDRHDPMDYIQTPDSHEGRVDYKFWGTFIRRQIRTEAL